MGVEELHESAPPGPIIGPIEHICRLGQGTHDRVLPGLSGQPHQLRGLSDLRRWWHRGRLVHVEISGCEDGPAAMVDESTLPGRSTGAGQGDDSRRSVGATAGCSKLRAVARQGDSRGAAAGCDGAMSGITEGRGTAATRPRLWRQDGRTWQRDVSRRAGWVGWPPGRWWQGATSDATARQGATLVSTTAGQGDRQADGGRVRCQAQRQRKAR